MFVRYSNDHTDGLYRMWNSNSKRVHVSRGIIWLKRMFYQHDNTAEITTRDLDSDIEIDPNTEIRESDSSNETSGNESSDDEEEELLPLIQDVDSDDKDEGEYADLHPLVKQDVDNDDDEDDDSDDENEEEAIEYAPAPREITRSWREIRLPERYTHDLGVLALTEAEFGYQVNLREIVMAEVTTLYHEVAFVGAGVGSGIQHTSELRVMKYKEAIVTKDKKHWKQAVKEEQESMYSN